MYTYERKRKSKLKGKMVRKRKEARWKIRVKGTGVREG
jgi:hypothetical protein